MQDFNSLRFQSGRPLLREISADRLNTILQEIRRVRPLPGRGITIRQTGDGCSIDLAAKVGGGGGTAAQSSFPFQVVSTKVGGTTYLGVNHYSTLGTVGQNIAIEGLLNGSDTIDTADPGLFTCPAIGEKIWLQIGTSDPENGTQLWGAMIRHGAAATNGLWEEYPSPISVNTDDPEKPFQEFYNLLIAEVTDPDSDPRTAALAVTIGEGEEAETRKIVQCWSRNIVMAHWVINGLLCLVPVDPALDYPATAL